MAKPSLRDSILNFLRSKPDQGATRSQLAKQLAIHPNQRSKLRKHLAQLVEDGRIVQGRKNAYRIAEVGNKGGKSGDTQLVGALKFHPKGHAFFYPDLTDKRNLETGIDLVELDRVQVTRHDTATALDGDRVAVTLGKAPAGRQGGRGGQRKGKGKGKGKADPKQLDLSDELRAKVSQVLERRSGRVVGTYHKKSGFGWVESEDKAIGGRIDIDGDTTASSGQLVVVDLGNWQKGQNPRGRIIEVLGWPGDPGVDMEGVIHRYGIATTFPEEVLAEARAVPEEPKAEEIKRRDDWRDRLVITIDPADAKDHDDAIWVEANKDGGWTLAVHIADVSHYIKPDSPMDKEAVRRGNSTYLVDRVLPMLPVELSNGICSLKPDVNRLTKCATLKVNAKGKVVHAKFTDAVIHSRAKISYEQAQTILDGGKPPKGSDPKLVPLVKEAWKMASALRRLRFAQGALDLEMSETKVQLDDKGRAIGYEPVVHTESHQLVEECMLAANEAVAKVLREQRRPAIYRVHED
ncbi:MAG: RNB domain-containing ribonuclease, partial [Akkermansiaceae bacterium]|nr:RNB domain-containing ribonuclease [Akkermansiaceae bacterium]